MINSLYNYRVVFLTHHSSVELQMPYQSLCDVLVVCASYVAHSKSRTCIPASKSRTFKPTYHRANHLIRTTSHSAQRSLNSKIQLFEAQSLPDLLYLQAKHTEHMASHHNPAPNSPALAKNSNHIRPEIFSSTTPSYLIIKILHPPTTSITTT